MWMGLVICPWGAPLLRARRPPAQYRCFYPRTSLASGSRTSQSHPCGRWRSLEAFQGPLLVCGGKEICLEIARSCIQCQAGTDYGAMRMTAGTIMSSGPWDTLSIDKMGSLSADKRMKYIITFVDCYSKCAILIPSKDYMAQTVSNTLLNGVIPYFGVPWRLLSDRGRKFTGQVWDELLKTLGIQRLLTFPYHLEGNAINDRNHRSMNKYAACVPVYGRQSPT